MRRDSFCFADRREEILENTNLGLWMSLMEPNTGRCVMYGDKVMHRLLEADEEFTPEEYYIHWYNRINDGYYQYVNMAMENIIQTGKITQGRIYLESSGQRRCDGSMHGSPDKRPGRYDLCGGISQSDQ